MDDKSELKQEQSEQAGAREIPKWEEDLVRLAIKRSKQAEDFVKDEKKKAIEDNAFIVDGEQWDETTKSERESNGLPCLVFNRAPAFVDRIIGEIKQQPPRAKVMAVGSNSRAEWANKLTAIGRHVERRSRAERHYMAAVEQPITNGYPAFLQLVTEYVNDHSFEQDMRIRHIVHQFSVKLDPATTAYDEPGKGGPFWGIIEEEIPRAEYAERFPKAKEVKFEESTGDKQLWWQKDKVRIASYYVARPTTKTILRFDDGLIVEEGSEAHKTYQNKNPSAKPKDDREITTYKIEHYLISGAEVLAGPEPWPGKYIPIIPVEPKIFWTEGKKKGRGVYRWGKDAGRMRNYWSSKMTESVALATSAPWTGTDEMFEGKTDEWESKKPQRVLTFTPDARVPGAGPRREPPPTIPTGAVQMLQISVDEEKALVNIDNSTLGRKSNETSGVAINARVNEAQTAHFPFVDNLAMSLEYLWIQILDLAPTIYDTHRKFQNYGDDGKEKEPIEINKPVVGRDEHNNVTNTTESDISEVRGAKYEVDIDAGPSLKTQRQETVQVLAQMSQSNPQFAQASGDLMARSLDFEFSDELADRLQAMLPPELKALKETDDKVKAQISSAVEQVQKKAMEAFQAAEQKIQQIQQQLEAATKAMNDKSAEHELKKYEIDVNAKTKLEIAAMNKSTGEIESLQNQIAALAAAVEHTILKPGAIS